MSNGTRTTDQAKTLPSRFRRVSILVIEVLVFVALFMGISAYQARDLLATDAQLAPALRADTLNGMRYDIAENKGRPKLIYFFAPWCPYCSASADNVVRLREWRNTEALEILVVALDWESVGQIQEYSNDHELNVPVLLGDAAVVRDWKIRGFPTYYVLDAENHVISRDYGYSTQLGLWWRSWFVG
jgi:thiol-disulfide isomerase/thioredoxin